MSGGPPRAAGVRALALALLAASCGPDCSAPRAPERPNVVLVTIDTLRADHLGCYGSTRVATPALDALAAEGALFERCYAQAPITVPSHLTILASLPPSEHGVLHNGAAPARPLEGLPALFARAGYRTAAFVGASFLGPASGFGRAFPSFETYGAPRRLSLPRRAEETNREAFRWLRRTCRDPFFAWVHYYDPHMPYTPPAPWGDAYYRGDPYAPEHTSMAGVRLGWHFHDLDGLHARLKRRAAEVRALKRELGASSREVRRLVLYPIGLERWAAGPEAAGTLRARLGALADFVRRDLPYRRHVAGWLTGVRDLSFPLAEYAGEVSYVDAALGALRAELQRLGLAARTVLVVTADHGESLGEHGIWFTHFGLSDTVLHVPLVVWAPGRVVPARRPEAVRSLDIAPTVLRLAGLPVPAAMRARDLLAAGEPAPVVADGARGTQAMLRVGRWKLVRTLESFFYVDAFAREAGTEELFDLETDPGEGEDAAAREPARVRALGAELDAWLAAARAAGAGAAPGAPVPEALRQQLRALGYAE